MKRLIVPILLVFALIAAPAFAEVKVGYVDLQKALNLSESGKAAKEKIAGSVKNYEGTIQVRQEEIKKLKDELEKQSMALSADARAAKERDYQQKLKEFQRFTKDIQEELQQKDADFTRQIIEDLLKIVQDIGASEGMSMVFEKSESSVLYADKSADLTDKVIERYNAQFKKQGGK